MPKPKTPPLADWEVSFIAGAAYPRSPLTVRATRLRAAGDWVLLEDTSGHVLFTAPRDVVLCVRRMEPGENAAEVKDASKTEDVALPDPESPAAEKVAPRRKRSGAHS